MRKVAHRWIPIPARWPLGLVLSWKARSVRDVAERTRACARCTWVRYTVQLPLHMIRERSSWCAIGGRWATVLLLRLWAGARSVLTKLERWDLRLVRVLFFAFACYADELKVITFGLLRRVAVAFAVLPHLTPITGNAMRAVVPVLAMLTAYRAVEVPFVVVLAHLFEFLLMLLLLRLELSLRDSLIVFRRITHWLLRLWSVVLLLDPGQLFFMQDPLDLTLLQTLLAS